MNKIKDMRIKQNVKNFGRKALELTNEFRAKHGKSKLK